MSAIKQFIICPVCERAIGKKSQSCQICHNFYPKEIEKISAKYPLIDLTPSAFKENPDSEIQRQKILANNLFANSLFAWFYDRFLPPIWALGLRGIGGIEREFKELVDFLGFDRKIILDLSCGTGIVARRLAQKKISQYLLALDYSEAMLQVLRKRLKREKISAPENFMLIRGDAESLPFEANCLDAIYAGAAMHCWENPQKGIEEVYRTLQPGGKLFATTFVKFFPSQKLYFFSIEELGNIFQKAGFIQDNIQIIRRGIYATIKCIK